MPCDIVFLSTADWDNPFWTNKQHVAQELASIGYRVLYIDSLGLRRPSASRQDMKRIVRRLLRAVSPPSQVHNNLWVWSPVMLPWHDNIFIRKINRIILSTGLEIWLRLLRFERHMLWTYNPLTTEFLDITRFSYRVYHCVDEIKAQPGMPVELLGEVEKQLVRNVDIVFTTSPMLTETRRNWNNNTHYLPNVADYRHFSKAQQEQTKVPPDLSVISRPIIGFIGAISSYKVDFQLLRRIAEVHPEWSIVLIGEVGEGDPWTESTLLEGLDNLYLLGPKSYQTLPAYLKGFDVAMLPNSINAYTDAMFPMKLFEYLASGVPVVSVNLKAIQEFADVITIAGSPEKFIASIEDVLAGNVPSLKQRLDVAAQHTYEVRTKKMLTLLEAVCCK